MGLATLNINSGYGQHVQSHPFLGGGQVFVVASAAANNDELKGMFKPFGGNVRFFATIDEAVNQATASRVDTIYIAPGHSETISNATSINLDKTGIRLIGIGHGNLRPKIILDTAATTTIPVSAADIYIENVVFEAGFADIVAVFTLTTAKNFKLFKCEFQEQTAGENFLYIVDTNATTGDADGLTIEKCRWVGADTANESMVKMDGDNNKVVIRGNYVSLGVNNNKAALVAIATGKSLFNARIVKNTVYRLNTDTATGAILVTTDQSDNSGEISENFVQHADTASELLVTASSGFGVFNNYASGVAGASGYLLPAADS